MRSAVLSGRFDARDRAHLRGRGNRPSAAASDPLEELEERFRHAAADGADGLLRWSATPRLFLMETATIDLPTGERLRQLAITLEAHGLSSPRQIDALYREAISCDPAAVSVWHSRGVHARNAASDLPIGDSTGPKTGQERLQAHLVSVARSSLLEADRLLPGDADHLYSLGRWHYDFGPVTEALEFFERALASRPGHGWASLYRAHCLHDLKRWQEAAEAYGGVPLDTFGGPRACLVDVVLEAESYCWVRAGHRDRGIQGIVRLLDRIEKEPARALPLLLHYAQEVADGEGNPDLAARVQRVLTLS